MRFFLSSSLLIFAAQANAITHNAISDSTRVVGLDEVVVIATPKSNEQLRSLPTSVTVLGQEQMTNYRIDDIKGASAVIPNLFIPDYGSRLTSSIYIRGVGSRINTPAVGLYVDNVPYTDKSAFDFSFYDIERIQILRGPQGTLYGRNAMGGVVEIHTRNPFDYQGTDLKFSAGAYADISASATHYHRISDTFAFSAGGFYQHSNGYFTNTYLNKKADKMDNGGGRLRAVFRPTSAWEVDMAVSYERNNQGGYAYAPYDKNMGKVGDVATNESNGYKRDMVNSYLKIGYENWGVLFSSVTGHQFITDRMFLDQDFTPRNIYTIEQQQKIHTFSEELSVRSSNSNNYQWVTGAFVLYQHLNTNAPVTFKRGGLDMIEEVMDDAMAGSPISVDILNNEMPISGNYETPSLDAALYHQSTFNNLFIPNLSFTVGIRIDYEKIWLKHTTHTSLDAQAYMMGRPMGQPETRMIDLAGEDDDGYLNIIPKVALKYSFPSNRGNVYATVGKGYRSGGYNIQMFSDIVRDKLMSQNRQKAKGGNDETNEMNQLIKYDPERTWNYEIGSHLNLFDGKLRLDASVFYMKTDNQQVSRFAQGGLGRMTVNSGRSRSTGTELSASMKLAKGLRFAVGYGYTNAKFTDYLTNEQVGNELQNLDYSGNRIPMIPASTFSTSGKYSIPIRETHRFFDEVSISAHFTGVGDIYFTEDNDVRQKFYGVLGARLNTRIKRLHVDLWCDNITNARYKTFYFETIGEKLTSKAGFFQQGKPFRCGIDIKYSF